MKTRQLLLRVLFSAILINFVSCKALKDSPSTMAVDPLCPVCHMKVSTSEGFKWKYNGQTYYFDSYSCRESFKMDPESILKKNNCDVKK